MARTIAPAAVFLILLPPPVIFAAEEGKTYHISFSGKFS
jgi:hypothetical protein